MSSDSTDYEGVFHRTLSFLRELYPHAERDRHDAAQFVALLRPLSPEQRLLLIRNSPHRSTNPALGHALLETSCACLPHDPQGSLDWAGAAEEVVRSYETRHDAHLIRSLALQGNAHRAIGRLERGRELLEQARHLLCTRPVADPDVQAEVCSLLGSLYIDLRQLEEAEAYVRAAAAIYRRLGDTRSQARTCMQLGLCREHTGDLGAALAADR